MKNWVYQAYTPIVRMGPVTRWFVMIGVSVLCSGLYIVQINRTIYLNYEEVAAARKRDQLQAEVQALMVQTARDKSVISLRRYATATGMVGTTSVTYVSSPYFSK